MRGAVRIETDRFLLRSLTQADVSERYLGWLQDAETAKYITTAQKFAELADLTRYVREREARDDVLFLGIFDRRSGVHIGNVKYEPVKREEGYAILGVLIGDPAYRGKRVAVEAIAASGQWLATNCGISQIVLGVSDTNRAALRAYESVGFVFEDSPHLTPPAGLTYIVMVWRI